MPSEKEPGFPGFFFLGLLPDATVWHLVLAQNWNISGTFFRNDSERKVNDHSELSERQRRVIPHLLAAPSIEEACKRAQVSKATVYGWFKDETFSSELKRQHDAVIDRALDSLKANIAKATETLVMHLDSEQENITSGRRRASSSLFRRRLSVSNWRNASRLSRRATNRKTEDDDGKY